MDCFKFVSNAPKENWGKFYFLNCNGSRGIEINQNLSNCALIREHTWLLTLFEGIQDFNLKTSNHKPKLND